MPVTIHQITAVLNMPEGYLKQAEHAGKIIAASKASTYVTVPPATLDATGKALTAFQSAATSAARDAALRPLKQALQGIMFLFQSAANADPANGVAIVQSGGFKVKEIALNQKHSFKLSNGVVSGSVNLEAEGAATYGCHDWQHSPDGISFTRMEPTMSAHTQMNGLPVGQYAYFIHQIITKDGGQGVSQVEKILVK